jgi:hypothetical protein
LVRINISSACGQVINLGDFGEHAGCECKNREGILHNGFRFCFNKRGADGCICSGAVLTNGRVAIDQEQMMQTPLGIRRKMEQH